VVSVVVSGDEGVTAPLLVVVVVVVAIMLLQVYTFVAYATMYGTVIF
jgi:hypothetical protein